MTANLGFVQLPFIGTAAPPNPLMIWVVRNVDNTETTDFRFFTTENGWNNSLMRLPAGGATGQFLGKASDENFHYDWFDPSVSFPTKIATSLADFPAPVGNRIQITEPFYVKGVIDVEGLGFDFTHPKAKFFTFEKGSGFTSSIDLEADEFIKVLNGGTLEGLSFEGINISTGYTSCILINSPNSAFKIKQCEFNNCTSIITESFLSCLVDKCDFVDIQSVAIHIFGTGRDIKIRECNARQSSIDADAFTFLRIVTGEILNTMRVEDCNININAGIAPSIALSGGYVFQKGRFMMENIIFSGAATPLDGVNGDSIMANWVRCEGVDVLNTQVQSFVAFEGNATVISPTGAGDYMDIVATYIAAPTNQKIALTDDLNGVQTYESNLSSVFVIAVSGEISGITNKEIGIKIYINDTPIMGIGKATTNHAGKIEGISMKSMAMLSDGDTIQVKASNLTDTTDFLIEDLQILIHK